MKSLIRIINGKYWTFKYPEDDNDFPSDPLWDVRTQDNSLSVFALDKESSNLNDIIIGFAGMRDNFKRVDYVILNVDELEKLQYRLEDKAGETSSPIANAAHRDIVNLSASKLVTFAKLISREVNKENSNFVEGKKVKQMIKEAIDSGRVNKKDIHPELLSKLGLSG